MKIPKKLHQIHTKGMAHLTNNDINAINILKNNNPDWDYYFYDYQDMLEFIKSNYSTRYLNAFLKINPRYGAAQADYFRYLLLYKLGGAYFDVKSYTTISLSDIILDSDELITFKWQGGNPAYEKFGKHRAIKKRSEYQQWNIICSPNNKYLENVIEKVTKNIENYSVLRFRYGGYGVVSTTGPIPYTNAIDEIVKKNTSKQGFRCLGSSCKNGIIYKNLDSKIEINKNHYGNLKLPVVMPTNNYKKIENYVFINIIDIVRELVLKLRG